MVRAATVMVGAFLVMSPALAFMSPDSRPTAVDDPEAYAVYASLLPHEWSVQVAHAKTLVFQEETGTNWDCMLTGKPLDKDWRPVVDSLRSENAKSRRIRAGFPLGMPYVVVPTADITASFRSLPNDPNFGWGGFYNRYPNSGGFMIVSAVGFDASKKRAMVYMAHSCGSLCAGGSHHLLEKVNGAWREAKVPGVFSRWWAS